MLQKNPINSLETIDKHCTTTAFQRIVTVNLALSTHTQVKKSFVNAVWAFIHMQDFYITKNIAPYVCQLYLLSNIEYDVRYNLDCPNPNHFI